MQHHGPNIRLLDHRDTPKLDDAELDAQLAALPAWQLSADRAAISRSFTARNFVAAIEFFGKVKGIAEEEGHHPDLHLTDYRRASRLISCANSSGTCPSSATVVLSSHALVTISPQSALSLFCTTDRYESHLRHTFTVRLLPLGSCTLENVAKQQHKNLKSAHGT